MVFGKLKKAWAEHKEEEKHKKEEKKEKKRSELAAKKDGAAEGASTGGEGGAAADSNAASSPAPAPAPAAANSAPGAATPAAAAASPGPAAAVPPPVDVHPIGSGEQTKSSPRLAPIAPSAPGSKVSTPNRSNSPGLVPIASGKNFRPMPAAGGPVPPGRSMSPGGSVPNLRSISPQNPGPHLHALPTGGQPPQNSSPPNLGQRGRSGSVSSQPGGMRMLPLPQRANSMHAPLPPGAKVLGPAPGMQLLPAGGAGPVLVPAGGQKMMMPGGFRPVGGPGPVQGGSGMPPHLHPAGGPQQMHPAGGPHTHGGPAPHGTNNQQGPRPTGGMPPGLRPVGAGPSTPQHSANPSPGHQTPIRSDSVTNVAHPLPPHPPAQHDLRPVGDKQEAHAADSPAQPLPPPSTPPQDGGLMVLDGVAMEQTVVVEPRPASEQAPSEQAPEDAAPAPTLQESGNQDTLIHTGDAEAQKPPPSARHEAVFSTVSETPEMTEVQPEHVRITSMATTASAADDSTSINAVSTTEPPPPAPAVEAAPDNKPISPELPPHQPPPMSISSAQSTPIPQDMADVVVSPMSVFKVRRETQMYNGTDGQQGVVPASGSVSDQEQSAPPPQVTSPGTPPPPPATTTEQPGAPAAAAEVTHERVGSRASSVPMSSVDSVDYQVEGGAAATGKPPTPHVAASEQSLDFQSEPEAGTAARRPSVVASLQPLLQPPRPNKAQRLRQQASAQEAEERLKPAIPPVKTPGKKGGHKPPAKPAPVAGDVDSPSTPQRTTDVAGIALQRLNENAHEYFQAKDQFMRTVARQQYWGKFTGIKEILKVPFTAAPEGSRGRVNVVYTPSNKAEAVSIARGGFEFAGKSTPFVAQLQLGEAEGPGVRPTEQVSTYILCEAALGKMRFAGSLAEATSDATKFESCFSTEASAVVFRSPKQVVPKYLVVATWLPLSAPQLKNEWVCPSHPDIPLQLYDKDQRELICAVCSAVDPKRAPANLVVLSDVFQDGGRKSFSNSFAKRVAQSEHFTRTLVQQHRNTLAAAERKRSMIKMQTDLIIAAVQAKQKELLGLVDDVEARCDSELSTKIVAAQEERRQMDAAHAQLIKMGRAPKASPSVAEMVTIATALHGTGNAAGAKAQASHSYTDPFQNMRLSLEPIVQKVNEANFQHVADEVANVSINRGVVATPQRITTPQRGDANRRTPSPVTGTRRGQVTPGKVHGASPTSSKTPTRRGGSAAMRNASPHGYVTPRKAATPGRNGAHSASRRGATPRPASPRGSPQRLSTNPTPTSGTCLFNCPLHQLITKAGYVEWRLRIDDPGEWVGVGVGVGGEISSWLAHETYDINHLWICPWNAPRTLRIRVAIGPHNGAKLTVHDAAGMQLDDNRVPHWAPSRQAFPQVTFGGTRPGRVVMLEPPELHYAPGASVVRFDS